MSTPTTDERADILRDGLRSIRANLERLDEVLAEPANAELEPDLIGLALASIEEAVRDTKERYRASVGVRPPATATENVDLGTVAKELTVELRALRHELAELVKGRRS